MASILAVTAAAAVLAQDQPAAPGQSWAGLVILGIVIVGLVVTVALLRIVARREGHGPPGAPPRDPGRGT